MIIRTDHRAFPTSQNARLQRAVKQSTKRLRYRIAGSLSVEGFRRQATAPPAEDPTRGDVRRCGPVRRFTAAEIAKLQAERDAQR